MRSLFYLGKDLLTRRGPVPRRVRRAILQTLSKELDEASAAAIARIEAERARLCGSGEQAGPGGRSVAQVCRQSSKKPFWCRLLFQFALVARPAHCLELGTCLGISGAYQAMAMKLNGRGRLTTIERQGDYCRIAREVFGRLELDNTRVLNGPFDQLLPGVLAENDVDHVFIDGHKSGDALLRYFDMIAGMTPRHTLYLLDDIRWSPEMHSAWRAIRNDPRVSSAVDFGQIGILERA